MRTLVELVSNDSAKGCPSPGTALEPFAMLADFKTYSNQQWVASTDQPHPTREIDVPHAEKSCQAFGDANVDLPE
jgi:hypothetical protein